MKNIFKWQTVEFVEINGLKIPKRLLSEEDLKLIQASSQARTRLNVDNKCLNGKIRFDL